MKQFLILNILILTSLPNYAQFEEVGKLVTNGGRELTKVKNNVDKELTKGKKKIDKGLTKGKKDIDKELTKTKKKIDKKLTNGKKHLDKELTKAKKHTDKELTKVKKDFDRELTKIKVDADRELTDYKYDIDHTLTIARQDIVTEWNYFWATVCGENSERKEIQRKFDQKKINEATRDSLLLKCPEQKSCGFGVSYDSKDGVALTDENGNRLEKPINDNYDNLPEILDWNRKVEIEDWEKSLDDKFVAGWLISPELRGGVTWFSEPLGPVTKSNKLREAKNGYPMTGARRVLSQRYENGKLITKYRLHKGTDYATIEGEEIYASFDGEVTFYENVHKGFHMLRVTDKITGHRQEILYVQKSSTTDAINGKTITKGTVIGVADNIQRDPGYKNVPNHVHVNFISPEEIFIAPNNKFGVTGDSDWVAEHCKDSKCLSPNIE